MSEASATQSSTYGAPEPSLRPMAGNLLALALVAGTAFAAGPEPAADPGPGMVVAYRVVGDGIPDALAAGDAARGKALLSARDPANCVLCHAVPVEGVPFAGNVGPPLAGVAARLSVPQLRLRVVDNLRVNPRTIMPSYYRLVDLNLVAAAYRGKTILTAPQVEDVVAYLATLR